MRPILKTTKKLSFKLKALAAFFLIAVATAFLFSLRFAGDFRQDYDKLHFSGSINIPECSSPGGFYKNEVTITLNEPEFNSPIYYTLDGSEPSLASQKYSESITIKDRSDSRNYLSEIPTSPRWKPPVGNVFKGTVLRAIAVDQKNNKSAELVRSFFVTSQGVERFTMPVISLTVNEKDLFGYKNGIYVLGKSYSDKDNYIRKNIPLDLPWWEYPSNYLFRGNDSERPAHVEFYETGNTLGFEADAGIRIHGNATRGFAQKSLRISFREKYGVAALNYNLFPLNDVKVFNSFILRNSGNDWNKTMFRDALMQSLMKSSRLDIQDYRPSVVFINGEYWGIHNIRERFDENYLKNKYGINSDSLTILELSGKLVYGKKKDEDSFEKLLTYVKAHDLAKKENFDYIKSKIDLENFSDFLIANIYFCNSDWPNNNVKFWRYKTISEKPDASPKDGRWRWMLFDTDWGFGYNVLSSPESNLLEKAAKVGSIGILYSALLRNEEFAKAFLSRFQYHLNTTFYVPEVILRINKMQSEIAPGVQEHIDRWRAIDSYTQWLKNVEVLRDFAKKRPQFQADQLNIFFNLKGDQQIVPKSGSNAY